MKTVEFKSKDGLLITANEYLIKDPIMGGALWHHSDL